MQCDFIWFKANFDKNARLTPCDFLQIEQTKTWKKCKAYPVWFSSILANLLTNMQGLPLGIFCFNFSLIWTEMQGLHPCNFFFSFSRFLAKMQGFPLWFSSILAEFGQKCKANPLWFSSILAFYFYKNEGLLTPCDFLEV